MKADIIEKFDRERYNALLWIGVGYVIFAIPYALTAFGYLRSPLSLILLIPGNILVAVFIVRLIVLLIKIEKDPVLKKALNNEMETANNRKSYLWGFASMFVVAAIFMTITGFGRNISGVAICFTVISVGMMAYLVSYLIYNRDSH